VAVSGLMGSVDAVWLYVFVMDFLNSLARDSLKKKETHFSPIIILLCVY